MECHQSTDGKEAQGAGIDRALIVANAVCGFPFTRSLIVALKTTPTLRRICGFERVSDVPSESTFSRAFAEFAERGLGERVHDALVEKYLKAELIGHISRDSTAIEGRE